MDITDEGLNLRWIERRGIGFDSMNEWNIANWKDWWQDGLTIWFSNMKTANRELAFAPLRIDSDREEANDGIYKMMFHLSPSAKDTMGAAAVKTLQLKPAFKRDYAKLILRAFFDARSDQTFEMAKAVLGAHKSGHLKELDSDLASLLAYGILHNASQQQAVSIAKDFEPILEKENNFRTVLNWCMKLHETNRDDCFAKFCELWKGCREEKLADIWRDVSEILGKRFEKSIVEGSKPSAG